MPRPDKVQAVEDIKQRLDAAVAVFLTEYRGLSVPEQEQLRAGLREAGADYKIVKMTLAGIAARELGLDDFAEGMVGPTGIAFAGQDSVATAKALTKFSEEHEAFVLKSGLLGGNLLSPEQVSALAKLPSREELLARIAGAMKAPLFGAAGLFQAFTRNAAGMMSQLLEKKEQGDPIAGVGGVPEAVTPEEPEALAEDTVEEAPAAAAAAEEAVEVPAEDEPAAAAEEAVEAPAEDEPVAAAEEAVEVPAEDVPAAAAEEAVEVPAEDEPVGAAEEAVEVPAEDEPAAAAEEAVEVPAEDEPAAAAEEAVEVPAEDDTQIDTPAEAEAEVDTEPVAAAVDEVDDADGEEE